MEYLEPKHVLPYLSHSIRAKDEVVNFTGVITSFTMPYKNKFDMDLEDSITGDICDTDSSRCKLLLRPMNNLKTYLDPTSKKKLLDSFIDCYYEDYESIELTDDYCLIFKGNKLIPECFKLSNYPFSIVKLLREHHFDYDLLIEKGLAIDINTLK